MKISTAFVLGAGLGTRLRPLTDTWPKPLLSVGGRPMITWAFDQLIEQLGVERIIVNTHHAAHRYAEVFPENVWRGVPLLFRHEPELLETGGGIKNIEDCVRGETFVVFNGDVLSSLPLNRLVEAHAQSGAEVTLGLRSSGGPLHIGWNPASGRVGSIRAETRGPGEKACLFTGIYVVAPAFLARLTRGKKESVVPIFLQMIAEGNPPAGVLVDEGDWWDLGTVEALAEVDGLLRQRAGL
jgi:NDP-sugar pyrophosphorylase family protein